MSSCGPQEEEERRKRANFCVSSLYFTRPRFTRFNSAFPPSGQTDARAINRRPAVLKRSASLAPPSNFPARFPLPKPGFWPDIIHFDDHQNHMYRSRSMSSTSSHQPEAVADKVLKRTEVGKVRKSFHTRETLLSLHLIFDL